MKALVVETFQLDTVVTFCESHTLTPPFLTGAGLRRHPCGDHEPMLSLLREPHVHGSQGKVHASQGSAPLLFHR